MGLFFKNFDAFELYLQYYKFEFIVKVITNQLWSSQHSYEMSAQN
jgi:hypothetical protein